MFLKSIQKKVLSKSVKLLKDISKQTSNAVKKKVSYSTGHKTINKRKLKYKTSSKTNKKRNNILKIIQFYKPKSGARTKRLRQDKTNLQKKESPFSIWKRQRSNSKKTIAIKTTSQPDPRNDSSKSKIKQIPGEAWLLAN